MHFDSLSIPCRYPVSEKFAASLRHFWTHLGQNRTESAPPLRTCAALPTRRLMPPLTSTLTSTLTLTLASTLASARAGKVAPDKVLVSPERPAGSIEGVIAVVRGKERGFPPRRTKGYGGGQRKGVCQSRVECASGREADGAGGRKGSPGATARQPSLTCTGYSRSWTTRTSSIAPVSSTLKTT